MKNGFTLLELAIVLAIIGLIAGGIVAGSSMIRNAEIRTLLTEYDRIKTAASTFKTKYKESPGDFSSATRIWGAASSCPNGTATGTETCNGDADGIVKGVPAGHFKEMFLFWQHLSNAQMIEGEYSGRRGPNGGNHTTHENSFNSKLDDGVILAFNADRVFSGDAEWFDGLSNKNYLQLSVPHPADTGSPSITTLTPQETWGIDTKIDDGKPAQGFIIERSWDHCTDAADSADLEADYALDHDEKLCKHIVYDAF